MNSKICDHHSYTIMKSHNLTVFVFVFVIGIGVYLVYDFYQSSIFPLESSRNYLDVIQSTANPNDVVENIKNVKQQLPAKGNPVWIFKTSDTDFVKMQTQLDEMSNTALGISHSSVDSSTYHTGMASIKVSAIEIRESIMDAELFVMISFSNVLFNSVWIFGILGLTESLNRLSV